MAWCFEDEATAKSDQLLFLLQDQEGLVPSIWLYEIANVLRMAEEKKRISAKEITEFFTLLSDLPIRIVENNNITYSQQCLTLAREYRLSAYDAAYLALALKGNVPLASFDRALCKAAEKAGITVL